MFTSPCKISNRKSHSCHFEHQKGITGSLSVFPFDNFDYLGMPWNNGLAMFSRK